MFSYFDSRACYVAQAGLKLIIFLSQTFEYSYLTIASILSSINIQLKPQLFFILMIPLDNILVF